ncbi:unnamed protein product [Taenia asiatica]|uniref:Archease domain-containing protein n=1 Tax=Taenia asiatica TaxID=60517 RepID=A0A0R3VWP8_TAEAS|nr:unnamed protein product [Taenia asiatica]
MGPVGADLVCGVCTNLQMDTGDTERDVETAVPATGEKTKGWIVELLENAVFELRASASEALDTAMAKAEVVELVGFESIDGLVRRITNPLTEVGKMHDVQTGLGWIEVSGGG